MNSFDGKFHRKDKLTKQQRGEIAMLVNAGVPYKVLTRDYGVTMASVHALSQRRKRWLRPAEIAHTDNDKFLYAQRLYGNARTPDKLREYVEHHVLMPLASRVAHALAVPSPEKRLLCDILEKSTVPNPADALKLVSYSLSVVKEDVTCGRMYKNIDDALAQAGRRTRELEHLHYSPQQWQERKLLDEQLPQMLKELTDTEQDILLRYYGIGREQWCLEEIGKAYGCTKQWAHKWKNSALETLQQKVWQELGSPKRERV